MANRVKKFRTWLADRRSFLFSRYTKDKQETQEPEKNLLELPPKNRTKLIDSVENLPSNPADKQAIASTLNEAFTLWQENPDSADNSVVVLSSPVAAVSRILTETLEEWTKEKEVRLRFLPFEVRPNINSIKSKLEYHLKEDSSADNDSELEVVVIPNLSWCFLRSLDGLDGIEYIQSLLCNGTNNRFWIIGAGQVGWQYLNSVCSLEAYCGEVFVLPEISADDFQKWFEPVVQDLNIIFDKPRIDRQIFDGEKSDRDSYYDCLADISKGVATVAVQLFLKSIRYEELELRDTDESEQLSIEPEKLIAQTSKLPQLPNLDADDRYLLYSLLLHGDLTVAELAESLGDLDSIVQAKVQFLRRQGLIEQRQKIMEINPIHYSRIKQNLASNNFIINRQEIQ